MRALATAVLATEEGAQLPLPPVGMGVLTFVALVVLLIITMQFNRK